MLSIRWKHGRLGKLPKVTDYTFINSLLTTLNNMLFQMRSTILPFASLLVIFASGSEAKCKNPSDFPVMYKNKFLCSIQYQVTMPNFFNLLRSPHTLCGIWCPMSDMVPDDKQIDMFLLKCRKLYFVKCVKLLVKQKNIFVLKLVDDGLQKIFIRNICHG